MSNSTVTIGVPLYNGANYLEYALESLTSQTRPPDEVLIYDNASEDESVRIAESYADRYPHIRILKRDSNVGGARNFNDLVLESSSTYFGWLCHDDVWDHDLLGGLVEVLDDNPDVSVAFGSPHWIDAEGKRAGVPPPVTWSDSTSARTRVQELLADDVHSLLLDCNTILGLIRRSDLEKTLLLRAFPGGDLPLIFELALRGRLRHAPSVVFNRRRHDESSVFANPDPVSRQAWFDPIEHRVPTPSLARFRAYVRAAAKAELPLSERLAIEATVVRWALRDGRYRSIGGDVLRKMKLR